VTPSINTRVRDRASVDTAALRLILITAIDNALPEIEAWLRNAHADLERQVANDRAHD
jgi:hypothetical protein